MLDVRGHWSTQNALWSIKGGIKPKVSIISHIIKLAIKTGMPKFVGKNIFTDTILLTNTF
ncbi:MAG: hypothetical protein CMH46_02435 [Muricauda sp.]|nr:hypothetical protein [Allomuricauda sp.]